MEGATFTFESGRTLSSATHTDAIQTQLPGLYNVYNHGGRAGSGPTAFGVPMAVTREATQAFVPPFGRIERVSLHERRLTLLLIKNPTGANEVLRLLTAAPPAPLLIAINDLAADGRDVSWLWDTDFEALADYPAPVIVSGIRAADMAVRLKYAGVAEERITTVPEIADALTAVAELCNAGGGRICAPDLHRDAHGTGGAFPVRRARGCMGHSGACGEVAGTGD